MQPCQNDLSSRFKIENFFSTPMDLLAIIDDSGRFKALNPYWSEFLGYPMENLIDRMFTDFIHPDDHEATAKYAERVRRNGSATGDCLNRYIRQDGTIRWLKWSATYQDKAFFAVAHDVTDSRHSEDRIASQQKLLHAFFEHGNLAVAVVDSDQRILLVSRKWCEDFGFSTYDEVTGRTVTELIPALHPTQRAALQACVNEGIPYSGEALSRLRMHPEEWMRWQMHPWFSKHTGSPSGAILFLEFTSEKKEEELAAITNSRLTSLGEMAAGIAHEISNPLTIIGGTATQLCKRLRSGGSVPPEQLIQQMERIEQTSSRISRIIKGLRSFARDGSYDPMSEVPLNEIIENTLALCKARIQQMNIELKLPSFDRSLVVECRETEICQVLTNLLNNAVEALSSLQEKWIRLVVIEEDNQIAIELIDSGKGVDPGLEQKIMQPFFTTKERSVGMGLGLSISSRLIEAHGGKLTYGLSPEGNTCFRFTLPRRGAEARSR